MKNYSGNTIKYTILAILGMSIFQFAASQEIKVDTALISKKISPDLFGLFFEDINYAADGGLYAEMVQNRSFEYSPAERREWNPYSYWEYISPGFSYGRISVETTSPIHPNNPHYVVIDVEHIGKEDNYTGDAGVGIKNLGFEGMVVRSGEKYNLMFFARQLFGSQVSLKVYLEDRKGKTLAENTLSINSPEWKKYNTSLTPSENNDSASLVIIVTTEGKLALDVISLFPENTFKKRSNGMRADLAQLLADMKPRFIRFPGGCLAHGDGLGNMYRWKNTIGPIETRKEQRNIWGYNQTGGLGYFEYFQFCEDIGAKPVPILPAAVSCQNSGGTWRIGSTGQKALPMEEMQDYVQEVLDMIEWANGPVTSKWGAKRAEAGHPDPFNLEYIGIGNEDKITPEFEERFKMIYKAVKGKHPEITVIGTVGPFAEGKDFEKGWKLADELKVPVVDEHYYCGPEWFLAHQYRYDKYDRSKSEIYLGEYASWGNKLFNALAEAAYMTSLERNGDVVKMASYAPLFAKIGFTQWTTDMIFFNNTEAYPTPNYYVQKLFSLNQGDRYFESIISKDNSDSTLAASCVTDSQTGDIILKLVNVSSQNKNLKIDLSGFKELNLEAELTVLKGNKDDENLPENPDKTVSEVSTYLIREKFNYEMPAYSLTIIRIHSNEKQIDK